MDNRGFAAASLLVVVVLGIVIGGGAYWAYKKAGSSEALPKTEEKISEPAGATGTAKPTTEGNFSHQGALIAKEDGWILLWDEPGRMALNVKLKFTDQSVCIFGNEKKDCGLINMGPESYDRVSVEGERFEGAVTVIKMEELELPQ